MFIMNLIVCCVYNEIKCKLLFYYIGCSRKAMSAGVHYIKKGMHCGFLCKPVIVLNFSWGPFWMC